MAESRSIVPAERIEKGIYFIRGQKVMLDAELAAVYGVATNVLNQAVNGTSSDFRMISSSRSHRTRRSL